MPYARLAVVWLLSLPASELPCQAGHGRAVRQRLDGATGIASADLSADGRIIAFVSLARLAPADVNTL